jgi:hypothetical protein
MLPILRLLDNRERTIKVSGPTLPRSSTRSNIFGRVVEYLLGVNNGWIVRLLYTLL